jgi:hypothetical protein
MNARSLLLVAFLAAEPLLAQSGARLPERAVRRDIPITNSIRRAIAAGTRDSTGRPGRNYAQLRTDYTIHARLDPLTSRITGRETIVLHNQTRDALTSIVMRLDGNLFVFQNPHAPSWIPAEETGGFVITRLAVNGQAVNRSPVPAGTPASAATENRVTGLSTYPSDDLPRQRHTG